MLWVFSLRAPHFILLGSHAVWNREAGGRTIRNPERIYSGMRAPFHQKLKRCQVENALARFSFPPLIHSQADCTLGLHGKAPEHSSTQRLSPERTTARMQL